MTETAPPSDPTGRPGGADESVGASDILSSIRLGLDGMSESQRRVARLFLDEAEWAVKANVEDIAARAGVSAPTIVRFARMIGCQGLKDLKLKLAGALALGAPFLHRSVRIGETASDVLRNVTGSMTTVIAEWQRRIDSIDLDRAAAAISKARRIDCLGTGATSHFLAQDMQARLFRLGLSANAFSDAHFQLVAAATLTSEDVLIAISFVGRMPTLLRAVEVGKMKGATVISLAQSGTPLADLADIVLPVDVPRDATMLVGTDAYVVQLIVIEVLMILVGLRQGPQLVGRMNDVQHVLRTYGVDREDPSVLHAGWRQMFEPDSGGDSRA
ncbi:MurR/RpiR family transcriptional regulator [Terrarubrum flagellatum]|uniref:MurR/RpiR family transcriptional regulator n=1 Tax=Terrirubrum flagellatum TaxID=2895980 RepID=UPI0031456B63